MGKKANFPQNFFKTRKYGLEFAQKDKHRWEQILPISETRRIRRSYDKIWKNWIFSPDDLPPPYAVKNQK